jgi:hypothetical protein
MINENSTRAQVLEAVSSEGVLLSLASDEFKNDKEIVLAAVSQNYFAYRDASESLKTDKDIICAALSQDVLFFLELPNEFQNNKELAIAVVSRCDQVFNFIPAALKNDKDVAFAAIKLNARALYCISNNLQNDVEFIWRINTISASDISDDIRIEFINNFFIREACKALLALVMATLGVLFLTGVLVSAYSTYTILFAPILILISGLQLGNQINLHANSFFSSRKFLESNELPRTLEVG